VSRVFVTGGSGFIGGAVVRQVRARGDHVTAIVRHPGRAQSLIALGAEVVPGDVTGDAKHLAPLMVGHDAVVHLAGDYRVGIRPDERDAMWAANVTAVERVIEAAVVTGVTRIVHVSTANIFGNTREKVVDETYRRDLSQGFVSWYDETKFRGHEAAEARIARGDPVLIAMPGTVYGPDDHSQIGDQLRRAFAGTLPYRALDDVGTSLVHVDDEAAGIVAVLDRGRVGEAYVLAGPCQRLRDGIEIAARLGGRRSPRLRLPTALLRAMAPIARRVGPVGGLPADLRETIAASDGVTYWASSQKATDELGFAPRDLETGLRDMLVGESA
jgi:nucleoside-diphosphate-sugar epimerase